MSTLLNSLLGIRFIGKEFFFSFKTRNNYNMEFRNNFRLNCVARAPLKQHFIVIENYVYVVRIDPEILYEQYCAALNQYYKRKTKNERA